MFKFLKALAIGILSLHLANAFAAGSQTPPDPHAMSVKPGLPKIGKWLIGPDGQIAQWLGHGIHGRVLQEPINVILRIRETDPARARAVLVSTMEHAGFPSRIGHTDGYRVLLDGKWESQFTPRAKHAFSDAFYLVGNNHGRIFGPLIWEGNAYFAAAFSREYAQPIKRTWDVIMGNPKPFLHPFSSFTQARDRFVEGMIAQGGAKISDFIEMENAITDDPQFTTADHDGKAVLLDL